MGRYDQPIEPQVEKVIDFYGDPIPVAQTHEGKLLVPLRPLVAFLNLDYSSQYKRINRDAVLKKRIEQVLMQSEDGSTRLQVCLPLDLIPGWLFGIDTGRVRAELQDKLNRYREECFAVLWNAFKGDILPAEQQVQTLTPAEQILAQAEAIAAIARQQVEIERQQKIMAEYTRGFIVDTRHRLADHDTTLATHDTALINYEQRLVSIELRLDPAAQITDEQAAEIALGVKNVAYAMSGGSRSYGKVYSEIYRRYRISSYKNLPRAKYDEVIAWLSRWYDEVSGEDTDEDKAQD